MHQFLVIIRGAPASGKTTIAQNLRNYKKKIVWLKVDNFKPFFAEDATLAEQEDVDKSALAVLKDLLDRGFSVVMEKIFYDSGIIPLAVEEAKKRNVASLVFQTKCSLKELQNRDLNRPGIAEGCRKPLGGEIIKSIYQQLEETCYPGSIELDTEILSLQKCLELINNELNKSHSD